MFSKCAIESCTRDRAGANRYTLNVETGELDHTKRFRDPKKSGSTKG